MLEALAFTLRILRTERMLDSSATMPSRAMGMISLCFKLIFFMMDKSPLAFGKMWGQPGIPGRRTGEGRGRGRREDRGQGAVMPVTMVSSSSWRLFSEGVPARISAVKAVTGSQ